MPLYALFYYILIYVWFHFCSLVVTKTMFFANVHSQRYIFLFVKACLTGTAYCFKIMVPGRPTGKRDALKIAVSTCDVSLMSSAIFSLPNRTHNCACAVMIYCVKTYGVMDLLCFDFIVCDCALMYEFILAFKREFMLKAYSVVIKKKVCIEGLCELHRIVVFQ